jgi:hypothetical protein
MSVPGMSALHRMATAPRLVRAVGAAGVALGLVLAGGATTTALASTNGSLTSDDGTLHTGVGTYGDCSGRTPLQTREAAIDACIPGRTYFVGHNVGVFTPLMHMRVGDHITWSAASGQRHRLRIVAIRDWVAAHGTAPVMGGGVVAQFQTCIRPDGSLDRILDAVEDGARR